MKVRTLRNITGADGVIIGPGEEFEAPDNYAQTWLAAGAVEAVAAKRRGRPPKSDATAENAAVEGADASE